ncbi:MAG: hypothetical protein AVDCRST_MAG68-3535, partial [uncultured Gemmatimonadetes bacterium]
VPRDDCRSLPCTVAGCAVGRAAARRGAGEGLPGLQRLPLRPGLLPHRDRVGGIRARPPGRGRARPHHPPADGERRRGAHGGVPGPAPLPGGEPDAAPHRRPGRDGGRGAARAGGGHQGGPASLRQRNARRGPAPRVAGARGGGLRARRGGARPLGPLDLSRGRARVLQWREQLSLARPEQLHLGQPGDRAVEDPPVGERQQQPQRVRPHGHHLVRQPARVVQQLGAGGAQPGPELVRRGARLRAALHVQQLRPAAARRPRGGVQRLSLRGVEPAAAHLPVRPVRHQRGLRRAHPPGQAGRDARGALPHHRAGPEAAVGLGGPFRGGRAPAGRPGTEPAGALRQRGRAAVQGVHAQLLRERIARTGPAQHPRPPRNARGDPDARDRAADGVPLLRLRGAQLHLRLHLQQRGEPALRRHQRRGGLLQL